MRSVFVATAVLSVCLCSTQELECNDDDESALLQGRLVQVHPLRTEHEEDELPASLLKSVQNLARQATRQTPEDVAEGIASVNAALEQMMTRLEDGHARAQQHIQSQLEEIQACHSSTSHGVTVRDDFQNQLAVMHTCIEDQAAASQTQQQRCDAWNSHADRLSFPSTNLPASATPSERYLVATQLRDWVADEWPAVESQNAECSESTAHATAETERCTPVIANYAAVFCQLKLSCNLLTACHHHEVDVYHSLISESEIGMASRQDQYRTVRQTECLMQLITEALSANTTVEESALNACDGDVDVQHLVLSLPDSEVLQPLSECTPAQEGDPVCPEVQLPVAWQGGEAAQPIVSAPVMSFTSSLSETPFPAVDVEVGMECWDYSGSPQESWGPFRLSRMPPGDFWEGSTLFRQGFYPNGGIDFTFSTNQPVALYTFSDTSDGGVSRLPGWEWVDTGPLECGGGVQTFWRLIDQSYSFQIASAWHGVMIARPLLPPDMSLTSSHSPAPLTKVEVQEGMTIWSDADWTLNNVPSAWLGATLFQQTYDTPAGTEFTFRTNRPAMLYVFYDTRNGGMYRMLRDWHGTGSCTAGGAQIWAKVSTYAFHGEYTFTTSSQWVGAAIAVPIMAEDCSATPARTACSQ